MKKFIYSNKGYVLPFLLAILVLYSSFLSFYLVQYSYKLRIYNNLEKYYIQEIKNVLVK
ncbi:hypothetical protein GCM10010896_06140 [Mammaliicoccus stepanovicii]|uniref:Uncharacterized protein n=1 Tax=Mammaliicoccus stepanovicii TaxID=643214 RepID=A0A239Z7V3_9STAP|nr:hypothetical protein GCM10010896_06140 [Mammaliicoccus stepanovicii]SNV66674.1 Uncharacterised protein [Mammaliicoccus stepanovicii]